MTYPIRIRHRTHGSPDLQGGRRSHVERDKTILRSNVGEMEAAPLTLVCKKKSVHDSGNSDPRILPCRLIRMRGMLS